ncbi:MAG: SIR2 family protein [Actinomycetota bacterium]
MKSFLLGAGASMDAGLPGSFGLTRAVADHIGESGRHRSVGQLLHVVVGAMVQHETGRGGSAFDGIDVERVFAAVKALKDRDAIDLSAFVESWNRNLDVPSGRVPFPGFWAKNFQRAVLDSSAHSLASEFETGVRAITETKNNEMFERLETAMLNALVRILGADESRVGYLDPIIHADSLNGIATLNYDLTVESACAAAGLSVDTGLDSWRGGYDWAWATPSADVKLLKLHGSLDYVLGRADREHSRVRGDRLSKVGEAPEGRPAHGVPAMVFGQGSKLRSDGPFLAMLVELDRMLSNTEWLTVVGYSFRDDHINAALTRWLNSERAVRISVIDPAIESWQNGMHREGPAYWYEVHRAAKAPATFERARWRPVESDFIAATAAEGLAELHGEKGLLHG